MNVTLADKINWVGYVDSEIRDFPWLSDHEGVYLQCLPYSG